MWCFLSLCLSGFELQVPRCLSRGECDGARPGRAGREGDRILIEANRMSMAGAVGGREGEGRGGKGWG